MTIYHRLKVWAIKVWRVSRYAFMQVRPRTVNQIFREVVKKRCDYCGVPNVDCVVLECDLEIYATICEQCTNTIWKVFNPGGTVLYADTPSHTARGVVEALDHRGVVVH